MANAEHLAILKEIDDKIGAPQSSLVVMRLFLTTDIAQHLRPGADSQSPDRSPGAPDPDLVAKVENSFYLHTAGCTPIATRRARRRTW